MDPKLERKISRFSSKQWKEYATALEKVKQMESATSNAQVEGCSGSGASMPASRLDLISNAVVAHLDEYKDALFTTPDVSSSTPSLNNAITFIKKDLQELYPRYSCDPIPPRLKESHIEGPTVGNACIGGRDPSSDD